ncbi:hypothetical protein QQS21_002321 [Conoideocrella luteorostrata]|uniref:Centrosomin N-terminal motif 1 domain-containing protein n=1 Tax=Conoideocrella luteorostrata TaxID=1105319 RepID=A0AAJ0G1D7_9HYPO|nr:hypothetical protein QQS21_002321 [Conoideocrella luteorostrata]
MDRAQSQARSRQYPRAPSRSSTHTSTSRMTSISANSSSSHIATSPQLSQTHPTHRYHHIQDSTGSPRPMSRPTPPLSRQDSIESTRQPAMSSFLQEKLQRERKVEVEKLNQSQSSLPRSNPDMNGSVELGRAPSSPQKTSSEASRPRSSTGLEHGKKKGLGVNEMEQVISTLHKQNFDLKLELYHRRERQTTLEERIDALDNDKLRMEEINDKLLIELEKRDKAVEEAVAMIVTLEAKVDQMFRERTMVQRIENEPFFCPRDYGAGYKTPVPQGLGPDIAKLEDDAKVINRMPSFLSDISETTENLRKVYLGSKASVLSLPRVTESSPEADNVQALGSPTLSVLSESSFVSVYGQQEKGSFMHQGFTDVDETLVLDGADSSFTKGLAEGQTPRTKTRSVSSSNTMGSRASSAGKFQSITDVIGGSPLQRLERLEMSYSSKRETARSQNQGKEFPKAQFVSDNRPTGPRGPRQDKRDTLRRVLTDGPGGVRLHDHALPPTPDTISSSTLRNLQESNDTLSQEQDAGEGSSNGVSLNSMNQGEKPQNSRTVTMPGGPGPQREVESWASPSRSTIDSLFEHRGPLITRPRSADESTVSHRRGQGWESDNDDDSDAHSLQSSLDIWMRESAQPSGNKRRDSPDLFSFPPGGSKRSWAIDSMYGPADSNQPPPGFDYMRDLFSVRQGLFANAAPPPPNRRSSLHARTGSSEATSQGANSQAGDQVPPPSSKRRSYHSRQNSVDLSRRDDMRTPVQRDQFSAPPQPSSDQKPKHYPPITSQHGARAGLNRLFRRSTSCAPAVSTSDNSADSASPETIKNHSSVGVPSWASRSSAVEDDRSGATPPPIMFNPRQSRQNTIGAEGDPEGPSTQEYNRSKTPNPAMTAAAAQKEVANAESTPVAPSGTGTRRKWLPGFSRASSSKTKSG